MTCVLGRDYSVRYNHFQKVFQAFLISDMRYNTVSLGPIFGVQLGQLLAVLS